MEGIPVHHQTPSVQTTAEVQLERNKNPEAMRAAQKALGDPSQQLLCYLATCIKLYTMLIYMYLLFPGFSILKSWIGQVGSLRCGYCPSQLRSKKRGHTILYALSDDQVLLCLCCYLFFLLLCIFLYVCVCVCVVTRHFEFLVIFIFRFGSILLHNSVFIRSYGFFEGCSFHIYMNISCFS